jgi:alpha-ketoglutarate-dependent 2,4-dichlorophenoxyacetate dioxygenase
LPIGWLVGGLGGWQYGFQKRSTDTAFEARRVPVTLDTTPLGPDFGARITGVRLVDALDEASFEEIRVALDTFSVLVLPDQPMTDDEQIAVGERFGPLETTISANPARGTVFARQSTIDMASGDLIGAEDRRMNYQKANMFWHADSTFKTVPSLCSLLSAREVPPEGGATEFVSTRTVYDELPPDRQAELDDLVVEHSLVYSRGLAGFTFTEEEAAETPPVRHRLVQTNPVNGLKSLMIGAHASHIVGWPLEEGRALLADLLARATDPERCYRHEWRQGDMVIWDNRASLHRATPFDAGRHRRLMQRLTVSSGEAAA